MNSVEYYDREVETMNRAGLEQLQFQKLHAMLARVYASNEFYRNRFRAAGVSLSDITGMEDLAKLPFTIKRDLETDQETHPIFGTNLTEPLEHYIQYHQTSGTTGKPLKFLDTRESWEWRARVAGIILKGVGVRQADHVLFAFNFGPYTAFWVMYEGAYRLGALVIPTGGWNSQQRLQCILENRATVLPLTPTHAVRLAETAMKEGMDLVNSDVRIVLLSGEPGALVPAIRDRVESMWGARCREYIGMTEVGTWGFQCTEEANGVHVVESEFIPEIVDPKTGKAVAEGETGELVLTNLGRSCMPAIRYRTGDLVKVKKGICQCGRTARVLDGGVLGRKDDMLVIRGVNVFPSYLLGVVETYRDPGDESVVEAYQNNGVNEIRVKLEMKEEQRFEKLAQEIQDDIRKRLSLRVNVINVGPGGIQKTDHKTKRFVDLRKATA